MPEHSPGERRRDDLEAARRLSEEFSLGEVREIAPAKKYYVAFWGGCLAIVTGIAGIPAIAGDAGWAKVINAAVFCPLFLAGCLTLWLGITRAPVTARLFWYSRGLAEFARDEPEPRVLRWADVETITTVFHEGDETPTVLARCILRGKTGTEPLDLGGYPRNNRYPNRVLRALTAEATRVLAPRLLPPLIEAYESGEPVTAGNARIDRAGITVNLPVGEPIAWTEIGSITTRHVTSMADNAAPVKEIEICKHSGRICRLISLDGVPNAVFLPHLFARAAEIHGIPLNTSPRNLTVPWLETYKADR
jgi:hypothetical protein